MKVQIVKRETHLEIKNAVDSLIKLMRENHLTIKKQDRAIGKKLQCQFNNWVETDKLITKPTSPKKFISPVVDLFNVSTSEKGMITGCD